MKNFWGEPDDEPLPDWMNPETYRNGNNLKRKPAQSLEEAAAAALKKPAVPIVIVPPTGNETDK